MIILSVGVSIIIWKIQMGLVVKNDPFRLNWLIALFFYSKTLNIREDLRHFTPANLRKAIRKEFNDNPLLGILGIRKIYFRICDCCYFTKITKIVRDYVYSCSTCQRFIYDNARLDDKLTPIKVSYHLECVEPSFLLQILEFFYFV